MSILVVGGTGNVGRVLVPELVGRGCTPRVLVRDPDKARLPEGATSVGGDLDDPASIRAALEGVRTLYLLNATGPGELTQALLAINLAIEAGVERFVYHSILGIDTFPGVPHVAAKAAVERFIREAGLRATILRNSYFMQNDLVANAVLAKGVYPIPIGRRGVAAVDVRDVGEAAAIEIARRDRSDDNPPACIIPVCGPETLTGDDAAAIWTDVLGLQVAYAGDDVAAAERAMVSLGMPAWAAYDLALMFADMQANGQAEAGGARKLEALLGRPPRDYARFARDFAPSWTER